MKNLKIEKFFWEIFEKLIHPLAGKAENLARLLAFLFPTASSFSALYCIPAQVLTTIAMVYTNSMYYFNGCGRPGVSSLPVPRYSA